MAIENIASIFQNRVYSITDSDIAYGIERFLRGVLKSQRILCKSDAHGRTITVRVATPALAQQALLYEHDIRHFASTELGCTIQALCVLL